MALTPEGGLHGREALLLAMELSLQFLQVGVILAIIGAIVVAGWVLKITFNLLGPLLLIGVAVLIYFMFFKKDGRR